MEGFVTSESVGFIPRPHGFPGVPGMLAAAAGTRLQMVSRTLRGTAKGPQVGGREWLEHGMRIMYKVEGMTRRCKGIVVGSDAAGWNVSGARRADGVTPFLQGLTRGHIWTLSELQAEKSPTGIREATSKGGSTIAAAESRRRAVVGKQRAQLDEGKVLTHPCFVSRMRRTLSHLANSNGHNANYVEIQGALHNDDPVGNELYSEYIAAALNSYRTETSKAPEQDLDELRDVLAGNGGKSRILVSMTRAGKTAALRHIMAHQKYLQEHSSYYGTMEDDQESGMRAIARQCHSVPEHESDGAKQAQLAQGIVTQLEGLDDPVAAAIINMKFGLDRFEHGYKEQDIAAALNRASMPAPSGGRWDADQVKARMTAALAHLAKTRGVQDLRGLLPVPGRFSRHCTDVAFSVSR